MNDTEFKYTLTATMKRRNLTDENVADMCAVSPNTVKRWREGITSPHSVMMTTVIKALNKVTPR